MDSWPDPQLEAIGGMGGHRLRQASRQIDPLSRLHATGLAADHLRIRFLEGLSKTERNAVLAAASSRRFSNESIVAHQGDPAEHLFLLVKGSARYFFITPAGRKVYLLWLRPGEIFGGATLLTPSSSFLVNTEVTKASQVLVWQRNVIRNLAREYPQLLENGLSIANDYLVWYLASHLSLICHSARQRLAHVLISLADGIGRQNRRGVDLDVTNEQLANTANITLFTASRLLGEWRRSGALLKSRGKILLCHPEQLLDARQTL
jgi:CRP/FNR family transcriptional regulator, nitrogen oxide reductase regulator